MARGAVSSGYSVAGTFGDLRAINLGCAAAGSGDCSSSALDSTEQETSPGNQGRELIISFFANQTDLQSVVIINQSFYICSVVT